MYFTPEILRQNLAAYDGENILYVDRLHLRVVVQNNGQKVAKSCYANIEIEKEGKLDGCKPFSAEPKPLRWVSDVGGGLETRIDVAPRGGQQALDVVFSDDFRPYAILPNACGKENISPISATCLKTTIANEAPLRAYAATPAASKLPWWRNQDGFCQGRFEFRLTVFSENSPPQTRRFKLTVGKEWNDMNMMPL